MAASHQHDQAGPSTQRNRSGPPSEYKTLPGRVAAPAIDLPFNDTENTRAIPMFPDIRLRDNGRIVDWPDPTIASPALENLRSFYQNEELFNSRRSLETERLTLRRRDRFLKHEMAELSRLNDIVDEELDTMFELRENEQNGEYEDDDYEEDKLRHLNGTYKYYSKTYELGLELKNLEDVELEIDSLGSLWFVQDLEHDEYEDESKSIQDRLDQIDAKSRDMDGPRINELEFGKQTPAGSSEKDCSP